MNSRKNLKIKALKYTLGTISLAAVLAFPSFPNQSQKVEAIGRLFRACFGSGNNGSRGAGSPTRPTISNPTPIETGLKTPHQKPPRTPVINNSGEDITSPSSPTIYRTTSTSSGSSVENGNTTTEPVTTYSISDSPKLSRNRSSSSNSSNGNGKSATPKYSFAPDDGVNYIKEVNPGMLEEAMRKLKPITTKQ